MWCMLLIKHNFEQIDLIADDDFSTSIEKYWILSLKTVGESPYLRQKSWCRQAHLGGLGFGHIRPNDRIQGNVSIENSVKRRDNF